ncbi:MAG: undecaprenyl diphosphate synthase family protein [Methanosarcinales archaeon]|jgi:undecaprenyl diphosphate synthase|nr:undecaprenyl diphosphate synthase family protein [Methanosarcinales archaeon]
MVLGSEESQLKTILLILNESDLLDDMAVHNLFSRFSGVEKEGVKNLIVYVDFLKTINAESKDSLILFLKDKIRAAALYFSSFPVMIIEEYEPLSESAESDSDKMPVRFVLGLRGRDELKRILSDFIIRCRNKEVQTSEMTPEYISGSLKLPWEPDLILSHAKHTLTDFMIWQTVYSEYYFFEKEIVRLTDSDFKKAFDSFHKRERRYGT